MNPRTPEPEAGVVRPVGAGRVYASSGAMITAAQDTRRIYWHRELPPLAADVIAEHTVEADSSRVAGMLIHRDELWGRCYDELMTNAETRLIQEIARLGGDCAHIHDESITPKHDAVTGTSWLHGRFTYMLYRQQRATAWSPTGSRFDAP